MKTKRPIFDERGVTATEYVIVVVLVACFVISVAKLYGQTLSEKVRWADQRTVKYLKF